MCEYSDVCMFQLFIPPHSSFQQTLHVCLSFCALDKSVSSFRMPNSYNTSPRLCGFISVGKDGRVFSFEVCPDHLKIARRNVAGWTRSWDLSHSDQGQTWPDNITFHSAGVQEARDHLEEDPLVDAVSFINDFGKCAFIIITLVMCFYMTLVICRCMQNIVYWNLSEVYMKAR